MRILFTASEVYPIAKTGGLADVVGSLPKSLVAGGHEVQVIMPRYGCVRSDAEHMGELRVPMGEGKVETAQLERLFLDPERRIPVVLIDHPHFFGSRTELYAHPDDGWRFAFFGRAVVEAIRKGIFRPEVLHCHDWHTGLVPAFLAALGTEVEVPTLGGSEKVPVHAGTQPGDTLTLRGKGLPRVNRSSRGDLIVHFRVTVPRKLSARQRELLQQAVAEEEKPGVFRRVKEFIEGSG